MILLGRLCRIVNYLCGPTYQLLHANLWLIQCRGAEATDRFTGVHWADLEIS